ncbi:MAG: FAD-dependent monooxygenase [Sphingomonadaceae bacterium]|nr:FAD-dependent monooxygenase [Sphingomonadaceae bacterium]
MKAEETPILIAGAGPTGLALAIVLQQAGIPHLLIERATERCALSRAAVIHAHTLEALDQLGVTEDLEKHGLALDRFTFRDRGRELTRIEFGKLPSRFARLLMIPQNITEDILERRLVELGGKIWRGAELVGVNPDASGVTALISSAEKHVTVRAQYAIGADGMHSLVRKASGIKFDGAQLAETFALADIVADWPEQRREVSLFLAEQGMLVVAPLPDGKFRLVAAVDQADDLPGLDFMQSILNDRGPATRPVRIERMEWSSRFHIHHRLAEHYRAGRLLLMGDAAHVHSPAGGQGMNTGLVDAFTLGQMLVRVIGNGAPDAILDNYEAYRRPAAAKVLALAGRLTKAATLRSPVLRAVRNAALLSIGHTHHARTMLAMNLSGIARRRFAPDLHALPL